jgi:hypothetical protein
VNWTQAIGCVTPIAASACLKCMVQSLSEGYSMHDDTIACIVDSKMMVRGSLKPDFPLSDLLEFTCVTCKEPIFITRKAHEVYERDAKRLHPGKRIVFRCIECFSRQAEAENRHRSDSQ